MLKEIFRTVPITYTKVGDKGNPGYLFGIHYRPNKLPYLESCYWIDGIHVAPNPLPDGPASLYLWSVMNTDWWPSWGHGYYRFDAVSGKLIGRIPTMSNLGALFVLGNRGIKPSRRGEVWSVHYWGNELFHLDLGPVAKAMIGDEPPTTQQLGVGIPLGSWSILDSITIDRFQPTIQGFGSGGSYAVDDVADLYLDGSFTDFRVFVMSTGEFKYDIQTSDNIVDIAIEDNGRCYVLMGNRTVVLLDYLRGEVLGSTKIPSLHTGKSYWNNLDVVSTWDKIFRRLLIQELTPDNPDGSPTNIVRGFRQVPEAVRITSPVPLKVPRQGRVIPVMTQVVGDLNEGVGGYVVQAQVSGSGSIVGVPITDHYGVCRVNVACEGSPFFGASGAFDWAGTGSPEATPPHTGLVEIKVSVTKYQPDPADIPITGVPGSTGPGVPGPPGEGGTAELPETAPNMIDVLQQVKNSRPWRLGENYEDEPDGRGAFMEAAVAAMHDQDERFGHIRKTGGQNQYNGHAVDACVFKNDDGKTGEVFDCVSGTEGPEKGDVMWAFAHRDEGARDLWYYPA